MTNRHNNSKDSGEEKIRERVKNSTRVYLQEFEPFLGFTSIATVQDKLEEFKKEAASDISKFYEQKFLEAGAALAEKDPGAFMRLRNNVLKPKGIAITAWQRTVHEIQYKERERIARAAKDAKQATAPQPKPGSGQKLNPARDISACATGTPDSKHARQRGGKWFVALPNHKHRFGVVES